MRKLLRWSFSLVAAVPLGLSGCEHYCHRVSFPAFHAPCGSCNLLPPAGASASPPAPLQPLPAAPGGVVPADVRQYEPPLAPWRAPSNGGVRLREPEPAPPRSFAEPPPAKPPVEEPRAPSPSLPAGIPQFAGAKEQVASGLRPDLDGVKWLQESNYRTALHLRKPGEDDSADRKLFELRGLKFLSLEVSAQSLSKTVVDEFNRIVNDTATHPLFIYDKDGVLAGGLWYLHFRTLGASDEEARSKAARLGLKEQLDSEQREMWLAIQKYLGQ